MQLSTAYNVHNRGTFHLENTALKSGDSSKDRQSSGESYVPYQQGDQIQFASATQTWPEAAPSQTGLGLVFEGLFNLDTRIITALIASMLFSAGIQALSSQPLLTAVLGFSFFMVWYVMSFFDFQRVLHNAQQGPRHMKHMHHQVQATF